MVLCMLGKLSFWTVPWTLTPTLLISAPVILLWVLLSKHFKIIYLFILLFVWSFCHRSNKIMIIKLLLTPFQTCCSLQKDCIYSRLLRSRFSLGFQGADWSPPQRPQLCHQTRNTDAFTSSTETKTLRMLKSCPILEQSDRFGTVNHSPLAKKEFYIGFQRNEQISTYYSTPILEFISRI